MNFINVNVLLRDAFVCALLEAFSMMPLVYGSARMSFSGLNYLRVVRLSPALPSNTAWDAPSLSLDLDR